MQRRSGRSTYHCCFTDGAASIDSTLDSTDSHSSRWIESPTYVLTIRTYDAFIVRRFAGSRCVVAIAGIAGVCISLIGTSCVQFVTAT